MSAEDKKSLPWFKMCGGGCLVVVAVIALVAFLAYRTFQRVEREVTPVATDFVKALEAENIQKAQQLTVKNSFSDSDMQKLVEARYLLDGFQSLKINTGGISKSANTNPLLSGTIATAKGTISYQNGDVGDFFCRAKMIGSDWRLVRIEINVDKSRYDKWLKEHPEAQDVPLETETKAEPPPVSKSRSE